MAVSERERRVLLLAGVRRRVVVNSLLKAARKIKVERSGSKPTQKGVPVAPAEGEGLADRPGQGSDETQRKHVGIQLISSYETDSEEKILGPSLAKQKTKGKGCSIDGGDDRTKTKKEFRTRDHRRERRGILPRRRIVGERQT